MINLNKAIESSKFLQIGIQDESERIPSVRLEEDGAFLYDEGGIGIEAFCSPFDQTGEIVCAAEKLTRAKLFRGLRPNVGKRLSHDLKLHFEVVVPGSQRVILPSGESHISEDEKACIWLDNKGGRTLYVNIFDINVAGQIFLINVDNPGGIEIEGQSTYIYGQNRKNHKPPTCGKSWNDRTWRNTKVDSGGSDIPDCVWRSVELWAVSSAGCSYLLRCYRDTLYPSPANLHWRDGA
ncbi:hypothetical protein BOTCAL_0583g00040 [Botryotinia calthae]|uniref:Uncharacterized protein n=1 Tax=Botryotinia calthae TaxID=38488 RepID=A0A4Y8CJC9_9HELO|nr:hypothetical protein BOTCAL_0583g00040 [Botryotinia calthae]